MTESASLKIDTNRCGTCGMRFSVLNLLVNLALGLIKGLVGFLSGSHALKASALYSINDVLSAIIVIVSLKVGGRPADKEHAYGHGKAEFVAIAMMSFVMVASVFFIVFYSVVDIVRGLEGPPHVAALFVALLCLVVGELLARMGFCSAGHSGGSVALKSSAKHNRADALSSAAVVVAVGGALLGLHLLDPIVAIFETIHVSILSGEFFGKAIKGLMDSSLTAGELERVSRATCRVPGVSRVALLRSRKMGSVSYLDIVVDVPRDIVVEQADKVARQVKATTVTVLGRSVETQVKFQAEQAK
ncbi:MAG: cation diffusion facilitator family transporter [Planctomycetota bacterium]|jgi:cation diffusion facilitator family transporter